VSKVTKPAAVAVPTSSEDLREFLDRAEAGDESTVPALRKILENPAAVDALGGDLARQAEHSLIRAAAGTNLPFREAVLRKLELMRAELAGPDPTPLERLLAERVVACWLQVQDADVRYAQGQQGCTPAQGTYHQRRMDRAHRRFLSAVRTLALVRRLALPVPLAQVNINPPGANSTGQD
jgi:hypothetical protein